MNIHQKIEALMARHGFSQQTLADKVGVSQRSVSDWCKNSVPRKSALKKLSEVFRVGPEVLLDDRRPLPEWEPPQKVKETFTPEFVDHLKKLRRETEAAVREEGEKQTPGELRPVLLSIDASLREISKSLQILTASSNEKKGKRGG
jgi:transcriptional regulator with XRE-family HTH domain